jgi:probable F420-dependent oxidoreductase
VYPGSPLYDAWVTLAYIAAATQRIRLGTHVYILPLRHPLVTARAVGTLDVLSGGRAILGAGVGWLEDEFHFVGESFADRGRRTDEIIGLLRELWSAKVIDFHGEFYELGPLRFEPKPKQARLPIEIGGVTPPAIRRAARLGDGWLATGKMELAELEQKIKRLHALRREAGRGSEAFEVSFGNQLGLDLASVKRYADAGVTRLMLMAPFPPDGKFTPEYLNAFIDRCGELIAKAG